MFLEADPPPDAKLTLFCAGSGPARVFLCWNFSRMEDNLVWYWFMRSVEVVLSAPVPGAGCRLDSGCCNRVVLEVPPAPAAILDVATLKSPVEEVPGLAEALKPKRLVSEDCWLSPRPGEVLAAKLGRS